MSAQPVDVLGVIRAAGVEFARDGDSVRHAGMLDVRAAVAELIDALRPFAELAELFDEGMRGGTMPRADADPIMEWPRMNKEYGLYVGNLRAARAALSRCGGGQ